MNRRNGLDNGAWCDYPRVCAGCGGKLTLKMNLWLEATDSKNVKRSWHFACRRDSPQKRGQ